MGNFPVFRIDLDVTLEQGYKTDCDHTGILYFRTWSMIRLLVRLCVWGTGRVETHGHLHRFLLDLEKRVFRGVPRG